MSKWNEEKPCCIELGRFSVCVVTEEDMGKKRIVLVKPNDEGKWFENAKDLEKHLNKMGVSGNKIKRALEFVNTRFRPLKKLDKSTDVDAQGLGLGLGVGKDEDKEV